MEIFNRVNSIAQKYDTSINSKIYQEKIELKSEKVGDIQEDFKNKKEKMDKNDIKKITDELNEKMKYLNENIVFKFNDKLGELVVKVVDTTTNKVIKEMPPKEVLKLAEKMKELVGILFDKKG